MNPLRSNSFQTPGVVEPNKVDSFYQPTPQYQTSQNIIHYTNSPMQVDRNSPYINNNRSTPLDYIHQPSNHFSSNYLFAGNFGASPAAYQTPGMMLPDKNRHTTPYNANSPLAYGVTPKGKVSQYAPLQKNNSSNFNSNDERNLNNSILSNKNNYINKDIEPKLQNIVSTANLGCTLQLRDIAMQAKNAEYNPKRFAAVIMRIKEPKTTALIFSSGKMVCTGAKSEDDSRKASRKYAKIIKSLGFDVNFKEFKIQNIVGSGDVKFQISLSKLNLKLSNNRIKSNNNINNKNKKTETQ